MAGAVCHDPRVPPDVPLPPGGPHTVGCHLAAPYPQGVLTPTGLHLPVHGREPQTPRCPYSPHGIMSGVPSCWPHDDCSELHMAASSGTCHHGAVTARTERGGDADLWGAVGFGVTRCCPMSGTTAPPALHPCLQNDPGVSGRGPYRAAIQSSAGTAFPKEKSTPTPFIGEPRHRPGAIQALPTSVLAPGRVSLPHHTRHLAGHGRDERGPAPAALLRLDEGDVAAGGQLPNCGVETVLEAGVQFVD